MWRENPLDPPYKSAAASQHTLSPPTFSSKEFSQDFSLCKKTRMGLSQRNGALLLVFVAAVCMEFYQAQHVVGIRCKCPSFSKIQRSNFTDFQVTEVRAGCDQVELTVTRIKLDNSTETLCINPKRRLGLQIISCWERINKDKSRKMECLDKQRRLEDRASED